MAEQLPVWHNPGVEPPDSLKNTGWQPGVKPAAQHMNWLLNRTYTVLKALQENSDLTQIEQDLSELEATVTKHLDESNNNTCRMITTVLQSILSGMPVQIGYGTSSINNGMSFVGPDAHVKVKSNGWYLISVRCQFAQAATGERTVTYTVNDGDYSGGELNIGASPTNNTMLQLTKVQYLSAGDIIKVFANQNSGNSLTIFNNEIIVRKLV